MNKMINIVSKNGEPLMPSKRPGHVRRLLKSGKAKVILREPFTVKLLYDTPGVVQELTLGVDTGSKTVGTAVVNNKNQVLYASEVQLRDDITKKMDRRRKYRRSRRSRKLRYRAPRFNNRGNSKRDNRYSPTIRSKFDATVREIEFIKRLLPIKKLVIEAGTFDAHLMQHKDEAFNKHWGYQRGPNYSYYNTKARVLDRDSYTCQHCKSKKGSLHVHHITYKCNGGSDEAENLVVLCESCHSKLHKGKLQDFEAKLCGKRKRTLSYATQMNVLNNLLLKRYPKATPTYGYITKANREAARLPKTHYMDAVIIAMGSINKPTFMCDLLLKKCVAKGDYQLAKGVRSERVIPTGKIYGFRKFDKVKYNGKVYFIKGRRSAGTCSLMGITGETIDFSDQPRGLKTPKLLSCARVSARGTFLCASEWVSW